jgi:hypothetical protein
LDEIDRQKESDFKELVKTLEQNFNRIDERAMVIPTKDEVDHERCDEHEQTS